MVFYGGKRNPDVLESKRISFKELEVFGISAGGKNFNPEGPFKKVTLSCADRSQPKGVDGRYPAIFIDFFGLKDNEGKVEPFYLAKFRELQEIDSVLTTGKNYLVQLPDVQYRKVKSDKAKAGFRIEYSIDPKVLKNNDFKLLRVVERPKKIESKSA